MNIRLIFLASIRVWSLAFLLATLIIANQRERQRGKRERERGKREREREGERAVKIDDRYRGCKYCESE